MKLATPDTFNLTTHGGIVTALALGVRLNAKADTEPGVLESSALLPLLPSDPAFGRPLLE